jgi:hypothetical protein
MSREICQCAKLPFIQCVSGCGTSESFCALIEATGGAETTLAIRLMATKAEICAREELCLSLNHEKQGVLARPDSEGSEGGSVLDKLTGSRSSTAGHQGLYEMTAQFSL